MLKSLKDMTIVLCSFLYLKYFTFECIRTETKRLIKYLRYILIYGTSCSNGK